MNNTEIKYLRSTETVQQLRLSMKNEKEYLQKMEIERNQAKETLMIYQKNLDEKGWK